jgi:hypothetical protein
MDIRKIVTFHEEILAESGSPLAAPLRRAVLGAVLMNPLANTPIGSDLKPLIDLSVQIGEMLTKRALAILGDPKQLRAYTKAALVGTSGQLEHGAAMIHARAGMAMRRAIRRGRVLIPGNAKIGAAGASIDMIFGPIDESWDLDAMDSMPVTVADSPRPEEILLLVGYMAGPRPHARVKGPDQKEVDALVRSFSID